MLSVTCPLHGALALAELKAVSLQYQGKLSISQVASCSAACERCIMLDTWQLHQIIVREPSMLHTGSSKTLHAWPVTLAAVGTACLDQAALLCVNSTFEDNMVTAADVQAGNARDT